nr:hypothetical protein [Erwinia typographi]
MDSADEAQACEDILLRAAFAARKPSLTSPDGRCLWCHDLPVFSGTAFCCAACGEDYAKYERTRHHRCCE